MVYGKISRDLQTARTIQQRILPDPEAQPLPERVRFATRFVPEMDVGGDYYDLKLLEGGRVGILLADVSGHGLSAAFVTGIIKTTFECTELPSHDVSTFLGELNKVLDRLTPDESFAAVVFAAYDPDDGTLLYANAGHTPPPFVVRGQSGDVEQLTDPAALLAGVEETTVYPTGSIGLGPGDKLVLATDGIPDGMNAEGGRFGHSRLLDVLRRHAGASADELRDAIMDAVSAYVLEAPQYDDQTVVVMEVLGDGGRA